MARLPPSNESGLPLIAQRCDRFQGRRDSMRRLAEKMLAMDPGLPESHLALSRAALIEMKWDEAKAAIDKALLLNPGDITALNSLAGLEPGA